MNDKLTTSTKCENRLQFYWEIATYFWNFSCSNWEKKILFSFGNDTGERSWFHREKNHCAIMIRKQIFDFWQKANLFQGNRYPPITPIHSE